MGSVVGGQWSVVSGQWSGAGLGHGLLTATIVTRSVSEAFRNRAGLAYASGYNCALAYASGYDFAL